MAHTRKRFLAEYFQKQASFWPVVGLMGLRQVGKTTFLREQVPSKSSYTFDDEDTRADALNSGKAFVGKIEKPTIFDEAQKVPSIFDAIKSHVDKKRIPGSFILSGSSAFSAYKDIRESLTGRIGLCRLYPMTYREVNQERFDRMNNEPFVNRQKQPAIEDFSAQMQKGGIPTPLFARDEEMRKQYWRGWLDTTIGRDLYRVFGKGYNPDIASKILDEIGESLKEGEQPTVSSFSISSTQALKYLNAMCSIFLLKKFQSHSTGTGRDLFCVSDSGLALALMGHKVSEGVTLSLARIYIQNEIEARLHYSGEVFKHDYFKSSKGTIVDWVWNKIPIKVVTSVQSLGWEKRALEGAMKTLKAPYGILVAPTDHADSHTDVPKNGSKVRGIITVPWSWWS